MKKISIALAAFLMAGHAAAADTYAVGAAATTAANNAQTFQITTAANMFIVNPFNFTVSSGVSIGAVQDASSFGVGAGAVKGRTVFTGHSNGGSVSQCGDQTAAGDTATPNTFAFSRLALAKIDACTTKEDIVAAGT